jgi:hypothetical protein
MHDVPAAAHVIIQILDFLQLENNKAKMPKKGLDKLLASTLSVFCWIVAVPDV